MAIRVFTAFSGYDSQCMALDMLKSNFPDFDYELVGWSEIDSNAIMAHNAVYPQWADRNAGDITKIDWEGQPDFDLFTYSYPCTDISSAGLQRGLSKGSGTRSSLLWECEKAIRIKRPKYLLMENVSALVTQKFIGEYHKWLNILEGYGYSNFGKVMNAKDYGIPQNRERIFLVSILGEEDFCFPNEIPLELRLKDLLEDDVDDKYVLSDKIIDGFLEHNRKHREKGTGFIFVPKDVESDGDRTANCQRAKAALAPTDNVIKERKYEE